MSTPRGSSASPSRSRPGRTVVALRLAGAGLLLTAGGIHLDLYLTGYRHIPTIGPLFLLQVVSAFLLALAVLAVPGPLPALFGAGFAISTLGGYILSLWIGLFGFHEVRTTAGIVAGVIDVAAFVVLGALAVLASEPRQMRARSARPAQPAAPPQQPQSWRRDATALGRRALAPLGALAALALVLAVALAPGSPSSPTPGPSAAGTAAPSGGGTRGGTAGGATGRTTAAGVLHVKISNFAFIPDHLTVRPGERIDITNTDGVDHTFTSIAGSAPAGHFDSGPIGPGKSTTVTAPREPGSYHFDCSIHPFMTGVLTVT